MLSSLLPAASTTVAGVAGNFFYNALLDGSHAGQTLGKRALRIRAVSNLTGDSIGVERGFMRSLLPLAFGVLSLASVVVGFVAIVAGLLDGLWPLWDAQHQTWHDKTAGSVVVRVEGRVVEGS